MDLQKNQNNSIFIIILIVVVLFFIIEIGHGTLKNIDTKTYQAQIIQP